MALLTNSPAINAGDPAFTPPPDTDQRGQPRVVGGRIDIGAYESSSTATMTVTVTGTSTAAPAQVQLRINNPAGATYSVWATTNLINCTNLATATPTNGGTFLFTDTNAAAYPRRFYEVRSP